MYEALRNRDISFDEYSIAKKICEIYEFKLNNGKMDILIMDYPFSTRTLNVLKNILDGLENKTLNDLKEFISLHKKEEIMRYRNFGKRAWTEVSESLSL